MSRSLKINLRIENFIVFICPEENIPPTLCAPDHYIDCNLLISQQQEYSGGFNGKVEIEHDTVANFSSESLHLVMTFLLGAMFLRQCSHTGQKKVEIFANNLTMTLWHHYISMPMKISIGAVRKTCSTENI